MAVTVRGAPTARVEVETEIETFAKHGTLEAPVFYTGTDARETHPRVVAGGVLSDLIWFTGSLVGLIFDF
jgi:hypothetical protein